MKLRTLIFLALICGFLGAAAYAQEVRVEKDLLGQKEVPANAYYGVQTARALENFQISGIEINHYPGFVEAWAIVKLAAAEANTDVGAMSPEKLAAIDKACRGCSRRQVSRSICRGLVSGRCWDFVKHER